MRSGSAEWRAGGRAQGRERTLCMTMSHLMPLVRARYPPSGLETSPTQWRTDASTPRVVRDAPRTSTLDEQ